jgi:hypothetical protein
MTEAIIAMCGFSRKKSQDYYKSKLLSAGKYLYAWEWKFEASEFFYQLMHYLLDI